MKVLVVLSRDVDLGAAGSGGTDLASLAAAEVKKVLSLVAEDFVREIYSRRDAKGAVMICEAASEEEARERLGALPFAQKGLLTFEVYGLAPYRGIVQAAQG